MSYSAGLNSLTGRTIHGIAVADGEQTMRFDTDRGPIFIDAVGDCCSQSYFEELIGLRSLIVPVGTVQPVQATEVLDYEDRAEDVDNGVIQHYGYRIATLQGFATLAFRNESNGYYGGSLEQVPSVPAGLRWRLLRAGVDEWRTGVAQPPLGPIPVQPGDAEDDID